MAQNSVSTGIISGRVEDPTGAIVADASVTLTSRDTGYNKVVESDKDGLFSFAALPPGGYVVVASAVGFKGVQVNNVTATLGQTTTVNIRMEIGEVAQQVQVSATSEVLNTTDSSVSNVINRSLIENLPSLRRNFTDYTLLSPTVTHDGQFGSVSFAGTMGDYTSNYAHGNGNVSFSVDGANATSRWSSEQRMQTRPPYLFGAESVQELQVSPSPYSPAYGGGVGYINTVTKSGTNSFHGYAFYFNRNTGTGAIDAVSKANGYPKALDVRQQFGAGLGGPIIKNKLFFFFDYEQQRRKNPISIINTAQAALNVTDFGLPAGTVLPAATGYPTPSSLRAPAPGNPVYLQQVANALFAVRSNLGFYPRRHDDLLFFQRVDLMATNNDQVAIRYNYNLFKATATTTSNPVPGTGYTGNRKEREPDHDALAHWTHTFSPTLLVSSAVYYSRNQDAQSPTFLVPAGFIPSVSLRAPSALTFGNSHFSDVREYEWGGSQHYTWVKGRHTLEFGAEVAHDTNVTISTQGYQGSFTFTSPTAFALGQYSLFTQSARAACAQDWLLYLRRIHRRYLQATNKLTLNFGFRQDGQAYPQPTLNPLYPLTGQFNNDYKRWSPRVGFAYHMFPRTVVRGGIGIFRPFLASSNYLDSTVSNGLSSLRSSLSLNYDTNLAPDAQRVIFPNILPEHRRSSPRRPTSTLSIRASGTPPRFRPVSRSNNSSPTVSRSRPAASGSHSNHLISSSYSDLNQIRPTGTVRYIVCPEGTVTVPCNNGARLSRC
ncbi:MAG: carboxypeptidase-like regulatory domain-containing protein [Acidobacteriota bacterium]